MAIAWHGFSILNLGYICTRMMRRSSLTLEGMSRMHSIETDFYQVEKLSETKKTPTGRHVIASQTRRGIVAQITDA
jgi:hypothetical protein